MDFISGEVHVGGSLSDISQHAEDRPVVGQVEALIGLHGLLFVDDVKFYVCLEGSRQAWDRLRWRGKRQVSVLGEIYEELCNIVNFL